MTGEQGVRWPPGERQAHVPPGDPKGHPTRQDCVRIKQHVRPTVLAVAAAVERGPPFPGRHETILGGGQLRFALYPAQVTVAETVERVPLGETLAEQGTPEPEPVLGRGAFHAHRDMVAPDPVDHKTPRLAAHAQVCQKLLPAADLAALDPREEIGMECCPGIDLHVPTTARALSRQLELPVGQRQFAQPVGVLRVRPAIARVQQVAPSRPDRAASAAGRVGVPASELRVRSHDPARHRDVDLEPTGVSVSRHVDGRSRQARHAGEADLEEQAKCAVDGTTRGRLAGVEHLHLRVGGGEAYHGAAVLALERGRADREQQKVAIPEKHLGRGLASHKGPLAPKTGLQDLRVVHVVH